MKAEEVQPKNPQKIEELAPANHVSKQFKNPDIRLKTDEVRGEDSGAVCPPEIHF